MGKSDNYINSDYFYEKCIWAISFCKNPVEKIRYLLDIFGVDPFEIYWALDNFFAECKDSYLDKSSKDNLKVLIRSLKNIKINGISKFDHMEANLNESDGDKVNEFIMAEYEKRLMYEKAPAILIDEKNKSRYFDFLKSMVVNDVNVLISHSSRCDKRTFQTNKLPEILGDSTLKYVGSINKIIDEYPQILNNKLFVERVNIVCSSIETIEKSENIQRVYTLFKNKNRL